MRKVEKWNGILHWTNTTPIKNYTCSVEMEIRTLGWKKVEFAYLVIFGRYTKDRTGNRQKLHQIFSMVFVKLSDVEKKS